MTCSKMIRNKMDSFGYVRSLLLVLVTMVTVRAQQRDLVGKYVKDAADTSDDKAYQKAIQDALSFGGVLNNQPRTGYACEGSTLTITCPPGMTIKIQRANYGRFSMRPCHEGGDTSNWDLQCMSTRSLPLVNDMCTSKSECWVPATNRMFGDPCPLTPKYLEAEFKCVKASGGNEGPRTKPQPPEIPTTTESTTTEETTTTTSTTTTTTTLTPITTTEEVDNENMLPNDEGIGSEFCDQTWIRNISWPKTPRGKKVRRPCPNNPLAEAWWTCQQGPPVQWRGHPDLSQCVSPMLADMGKKVVNVKRILAEAATTHDEQLVLAKEQAAAEIVEEVSAEMIYVSQTEVFGGDLDEISKVMEMMVDQIDVKTLNVTKPRAKTLVNNVNKAVVKSGSNLLDKKQKPAWQDLPQANQAETATRMINSVENSAFHVAETCEGETKIVNVDINIVLEVNVINTMGPDVKDVVFPTREDLATSLDGQDWMTKGNSIRLTGNTIKEFGVEGLARLIFATYNNLEEFLHPQSDQPSYKPHTSVKSTTMKPVLAGTEMEELNGKPKGVEATVKDDSIYKTGEGPGSRTDVVFDDPEYNMVPEIEVLAVQDYTEEEEQEQNDQIVNTNIISASINGRKETTELAEPIIYTLEHKNTKNIYNPTCSFWEYEERSMNGHWSSFGCELIDTNVTHSTCSCNHMTNFAVLMDVSGTKLSDRHALSLQLITYICCFISIVCLLISFITFVAIKNLQCDRNTIHKNLCLCLFIAQVVFLAGIVQYDKEILCSVIAGILHYFLLCAFMWMFLEGLQLYVMLIEVFEAEKSRRWYYYAVGYGIPAVVVGVAAGVYPQGYGTPWHCWLSTERGFIWAFVGPVVAVMSINIFMLSIAIYKMCEHAKNVSSWKMKEKTRLQSIRSWVKGAVVLVVLLGLTWTFGLLYFNDHGASIFWAYVFTILNSLQGAFIFLFHCLMNEKVQKEYKKIVRRTGWLPECIRVNYGGAKSYTSSTPNNSSSGNALQRLISSRFRKRSSTSSIINKSTSSTPAKWNWNDRDNSALAPDSGVHVDANGSAVYSEPTEDPGGYLEPVSIRVDSGLDYEDIHGDPFTSNIEGSMVDSNYLFDTTPKSRAPPPPPPRVHQFEPPINVDKYKIQSSAAASDDGDNPRASLVSEEKVCCLDEDEFDDDEDLSDDDDLCKKKCMESDDDEKEPLNKCESDNYDTLELKKKHNRISSDSGNVDMSSSLNDLNKEDSDESMNLSAPNINVNKPGGTVKKNSHDKASPLLNGPSSSYAEANKPSEEVAIQKLRKALSDSNEGLIQLYNGKKPDHRLSQATKEAMDAHNYRMSSSDC